MMFISQRITKSHFVDIELFNTSNNNRQIKHVEGGAVIEQDDTINNYDPVIFGKPESEQVVSLTDHRKTYTSGVKQVFCGGVKEFRAHLIKYAIAVRFKIRLKKKGLFKYPSQ